MIFLEIILLFGCIIYAAKLGGIGVGMAGGLGMAIAVFRHQLHAVSRRHGLHG